MGISEFEASAVCKVSPKATQKDPVSMIMIIDDTDDDGDDTQQ